MQEVGRREGDAGKKMNREEVRNGGGGAEKKEIEGQVRKSPRS